MGLLNFRIIAAAGLGAAFLVSGCATRPIGSNGGVVASSYQGKALSVVGGAEKIALTPADGTYRVKAGDTLWSIAQRHKTLVSVIQKLNGIDDPRFLKVGMNLKVPALAESGDATQALADSSKANSTPRKISNSKYPLSWPTEGVITSRYGHRWGRNHDGIDIGAPQGTPVHAADGGLVVFAGLHKGYGNLILLKHLSGLVTVYAHNHRNVVRKGQSVKRGQLIAKVGQTGRATGPHLHFEVRQGVKTKNPLTMLPP